MPEFRSLIRRAALAVPQLRRLYDHLMQVEAQLQAERGKVAEQAGRIAQQEARLGELEEEAGALTQLVTTIERERDLLASRSQERDLLDSRLAGVTGDVQRVASLLQLQTQRLVARIGDIDLRLTGAHLPGAANKVSGRRAVSLYLDLLEQTLTGMLYQDEAISPWSSGFDADTRAVGRDWPARAETMIGTARMRNLRTACETVLAEGVPGDFIETGVWRGGACIYMRAILEACGDAERRVFVADSFQGLPPPDPEAFPADAGDPHHSFEQLAISRADVEANFRRYGLLDDRVVFLEGWFKDTLPAAPVERLAILRLDGDMYESTAQALDALYHKVSPGGFVIIDDYLLKPCAAAVDDFRARHGVTAQLHEVDGAAVWWRVGA